MQWQYIVSGFSEIKSELRTKHKIKRPLKEIKLWFSENEGLLYAHDNDDHYLFILIALNKAALQTLFEPNSYAGRTIIYADTIRKPPETISGKLNFLFNTYGFFVFRA